MVLSTVLCLSALCVITVLADINIHNPRVFKRSTYNEGSVSSEENDVHMTFERAKRTSSVDWNAVNRKFPLGNNDEDKARRKAMFKEFDVNGNWLLSLAEIDKGVRDVLQIDELFDAKPAIMRAFEIAKDSKPSKRGKAGDDYVELREFKLFLSSLRELFEYWVAFTKVDKSQDGRISLVEFKDAQAQIEASVGKIDAEEEFKKIDTNGGGYILFDEFCNWAITKNLALE